MAGGKEKEKDRRGRSERRRGHRGRRRRDGNRRRDRSKGKGKIQPHGMDEFRIVLFGDNVGPSGKKESKGKKGKGKRGAGDKRTITNLVETFSWDDAESVLKGAITLRHPYKGKKLRVREGNVIRCDWSPRGRNNFKEVWSMRIQTVGRSDPDGTYTCDLADDLSHLQRSIDDFTYTATPEGEASGEGGGSGAKGSTKGYTPHGIVKDICTRYRVKVGKLTKTKGKVSNMTLTDISPLEAILEAYKTETEKKGKEYIVTWRRGKLWVLPRKRPKKWVYDLSKLAMSIESSRSIAHEEFTTALTVRAGGTSAEVTDPADPATVNEKVRKEKDAENETLENDKAIAKYGYVHHFYEPEVEETTTVEEDAKATKDAAGEEEKGGAAAAAGGDVADPAATETADPTAAPVGPDFDEMVKMATKDLKRRSKAERTATVTHPGIPGLRRDYAIRAFHKKKGATEDIFVTEVRHSVSPGSYTMDVTCSFDDPLKDQEERVKDARKDKARQRGRKGGEDDGKGKKRGGSERNKRKRD